MRDLGGLRRHLHVVTTDGRVGILDGLDIGLNGGFVIRTGSMGLDDALKLVVLDLAVAVEDHSVDELVFLDRDDQGAARNADVDIGEISGGIKLLHRCIDVPGREALAGLDRDIITDSRCPDAFRTTNIDPLNHSGFRD